ncbi:PP2C-like domain-containing protein CG9801 [Anneissia japonica]|uniref:PP2C-like domain-containing protein CG9801 n=1 Tax=Anneissia japonica TaxID=1529436 RepID=UPI0014258773|nr:PP2C-like domain-containing protein CG9801 [Anneissia japonica]
MSPNTFATFSGPDGGLVNAPCESSNTTDRKTPKYDWNIHHDRAFGNAVSLYEFNKEHNCRTGSPIADVFAIHATENGAILALADGVNWGPKPRLAAQCGVRGCMEYLQEQFFDNDCHPKNTHEVFKILRTSLDHGQNLILNTEATLTTICLAVVVQLRKTDQFVLCVVNVGDSLAYVYSPMHGVREVTTGCRDLLHDRDLRECGGALGPAVGEDPDLDNLTFSFTMLEHDDVVFLASDGITDNFDPAMAMTARVKDFKFKTLDENLPLIETADRQTHTTQAMSEMLERSGKHEPGEDTAMMVCGRFVQYVVKLTNPYRDSLEKYHARMHKDSLAEEESKLTNEERMELDSQRKKAIYTLPGKLDHASMVAFTVGNQQQECISLKDQELVVYPP